MGWLRTGSGCRPGAVPEGRFRALPRAALAFALLCGGLGAGGASAQDHALSASDRIRIRVIEWRGGQGEWMEWAAVGGEYAVSPGGNVLLPLIGEVRAAGKTPGQLAAVIGTELQRRIGLPTRPDASVEVVQFRPVYVTGEVERPGEFAYRPGLTVLQGVSLAGGRYRMSEAHAARFERDWIAAIGSYEAARQERRRLLTRQARLEAELADLATFDLPQELREDADGPRLLADERAILVSRRQALASALAGLRNLQQLYEREVASLAQKIETQQRQIELARRELRDVASLRQQGLAATARVSGLERVTAELESRLLDFETAILRARQEGNRAERDASDLVMRRQAEIAAEMQQVKAALDQAAVRIATARGLMGEASAGSSGGMGRSERLAAPLVFSILRRVDDRPVEMPAEETTPLMPGDVLRVAVAPGGTAGAERRVADGAAAPEPARATGIAVTR